MSGKPLENDSNVEHVIYREPVEMEMKDIEGCAALEDETPGEMRVTVDLIQQVQQPEYLLQRTRLVSCLSGKALQRLDRGGRHSQSLKPAFDKIDWENDIPALRSPAGAGMATYRGSVFIASENRVRAEERRRHQPWHGNFTDSSCKSIKAIYKI